MNAWFERLYTYYGLDHLLTAGGEGWGHVSKADLHRCPSHGGPGDNSWINPNYGYNIYMGRQGRSDYWVDARERNWVWPLDAPPGPGIKRTFVYQPSGKHIMIDMRVNGIVATNTTHRDANRGWYDSDRLLRKGWPGPGRYHHVYSHTSNTEFNTIGPINCLMIDGSVIAWNTQAHDLRRGAMPYRRDRALE